MLEMEMDEMLGLCATLLALSFRDLASFLSLVVVVIVRLYQSAIVAEFPTKRRWKTTPFS